MCLSDQNKHFDCVLSILYSILQVNIYYNEAVPEKTLCCISNVIIIDLWIIEYNSNIYSALFKWSMRIN